MVKPAISLAIALTQTLVPGEEEEEEEELAAAQQVGIPAAVVEVARSATNAVRMAISLETAPKVEEADTAVDTRARAVTAVDLATAADLAGVRARLVTPAAVMVTCLAIAPRAKSATTVSYLHLPNIIISCPRIKTVNNKWSHRWRGWPFESRLSIGANI